MASNLTVLTILGPYKTYKSTLLKPSNNYVATHHMNSGRSLTGHIDVYESCIEIAKSVITIRCAAILGYEPDITWVILRVGKPYRSTVGYSCKSVL